MNELNDTQEQALVVIPAISASLSVAGSGCISYMVMSRKPTKRTTYHRLLLAMSLLDILFSSQALFRSSVVESVNAYALFESHAHSDHSGHGDAHGDSHGEELHGDDHGGEVHDGEESHGDSHGDGGDHGEGEDHHSEGGVHEGEENPFRDLFRVDHHDENGLFAINEDLSEEGSEKVHEGESHEGNGDGKEGHGKDSGAQEEEDAVDEEQHSYENPAVPIQIPQYEDIGEHHDGESEAYRDEESTEHQAGEGGEDHEGEEEEHHKGEEHEGENHEEETHGGEEGEHHGTTGEEHGKEGEDQHGEEGHEANPPESSSDIPVSVAGCNAVGFLTHISVGVAGYNAALSLYYFLVIVQRMKPEMIAKTVEPVLHGGILVYVFTTAIAAIPLELYNVDECGFLCYIAPYPYDCVDNPEVDCIRGGLAEQYIWWFSFGELIFFFLVILVCQSSIVWAVRKQVRALRRYSLDSANSGDSDDAAAASGPWWAKKVRRKQRHSINSSHDSKTKEVATQATLYVSVFFFSWVFVVLTRVAHLFEVEAIHNGFVPLAFLVEILFPLQGFLNCLVFLRPIYNRYRAASKESPWWRVLRASILATPISQWRQSGRSTASSKARSSDGMTNKNVKSSNHGSNRSILNKKSSYREGLLTTEKSAEMLVAANDEILESAEDDIEMRDSLKLPPPEAAVVETAESTDTVSDEEINTTVQTEVNESLDAAATDVATNDDVDGAGTEEEFHDAMSTEEASSQHFYNESTS